VVNGGVCTLALRSLTYPKKKGLPQKAKGPDIHPENKNKQSKN
jgi:hypothetical protein